MKAHVLLVFLFLNANIAFSQCCAGGSGSPIAGGSSQGVLNERQFEINTNFQFINTNQFYEGGKKTERSFDRFTSTYEYFRMAYGVTKNFTMSLESGYYIKKEEVGLNKNPSSTYSSSGIGDLIIFPRYDILNITKEKSRTEITLGLGYKIPLGSYNDSTGNIEPFSGNIYYVTNPQAVQLTSGAQDIIFYAFLFRGYPQKKFRIFANSIYIKKGWNPLGEKLGDFASVGLFASKTFFKNFGVTVQLRGEWTDKMKLNEDIRLYAYPNFDPDATGYKKVFIAPQLSYTKGKFTLYAQTDFPVYQYVTKAQVGSKFQATVGLSFRFFAVKNSAPDLDAKTIYACPMHPEVQSSKPGSKCQKCGMDLEKIK